VAIRNLPESPFFLR